MKKIRIVKLFDKETGELILSFPWPRGVCQKTLRRKIFFQYGIDPDSVEIKYRSVYK